MAVHRLRTLQEVSEQAGAVAPAFVPCPAVLLQGYSATQLLSVQEIYRLAREQVEAARQSRHRYPAQFSQN